MSKTADEIAALLKSDRFNPEIIPQLEAYLISQVQQSTSDAPINAYDFDANRALIKLYQFFPQQANSKYILLVESLALIYGEVTREGSHDFGSLGCLISESFKKNEPFPTLIRCADLLDSCQFTEFWSVFHSIGSNSVDYEIISTLSSSNHAKNALRKYILQALSLSFKSTKLSFVVQQLDYESGSGEVDSFLRGEGSVVEQFNSGEDSIVFCDNVENTKRQKAHQDGGIDYGMLRGIVLGNQSKVSVE